MTSSSSNFSNGNILSETYDKKEPIRPKFLFDIYIVEIWWAITGF